ncbi:histidine phosphatase family protein [Planococcus halotolerans]|uniref:Histidine phosphatase family protein n=1 Tax=Planococcus halotolerans TaxID=2233542 RepID=A0A365L5X3_9BACL|nr:histidine phosphatase family protein [Planococcus halotolerans]RAZ80812.1 histidine phosphatase family protein [Planococcus halotolerans]
MDNDFILHLIRHAPTAGNIKKQYIGWTDEPILPFKARSDKMNRVVWGSDLLRCRQTASILFPNAEYKADPNFRECNFGQWEMKTYKELEHIQSYRDWIDDPFLNTPPDGESFNHLITRVEAALQNLPAGNEFTILMHGGPLRNLLARAKKQTFREQIALHGDCHTLIWENRKAFGEGASCKSYSVEPLMVKGNL